MANELQNSVVEYAKHLSAVDNISTAVFDYSARDFLSEAACSFCPECEYAKQEKCRYVIAHQYGCFQAERWNGLYIYYCPMSLAFVATTVSDGEPSAYAIITGPIVMGNPDDVLEVNGNSMRDSVYALPQRSASATTSLAQLQWALCRFLSGQSIQSATQKNQTQSELFNALYRATENTSIETNARYPLEIEQRLQRMIVQGDKKGAQQMINQLLGSLYFHSGGDFSVIKERAKELIVLFSRASMEGGADVQQIFGHKQDYVLEINQFDSLDELSLFLTSIFNRFVGYVFEFSRFEHSDILHKTINFIRENYAQKIALEDAAAHVGLSRSYLSTVFKDETGTTFTDYINNVRVEKSKELLLDPSLSLAAIADMVGYNDQSYYTKVFTRSVGISPGQFRKKRGRIE